jgi:hypothetical protein
VAVRRTACAVAETESGKAPENRGANRGGSPPEAHRFKPGQSGNPGGRPKKKPVTKAYEALAEKKIPEKIRALLVHSGFDGETWAEAWAFGTSVKAAKGDTSALKEITDRLEGKAEQSLKISDGLDVTTAIREAHRRAEGQGEGGPDSGRAPS